MEKRSSSSPSLQTYNVKKDALKILLYIGVPLVLAALILWQLAIINVYEDGDFTNAFTFFIEIGVAVFITILLFRYSDSQQNEMAGILASISDTTKKLQQINDFLEEQREQRRGAVLRAISNTLALMWSSAQMALFVVCKNGFKEGDSDEKLSEFVKSNVRDHRRRMTNCLEDLDKLMLMGAEGLDANMISALVNLRNYIQHHVLTETTLFGPAHPWSSTISTIHTFAKSNLPGLSQSLSLLPYDSHICKE